MSLSAPSLSRPAVHESALLAGAATGTIVIMGSAFVLIRALAPAVGPSNLASGRLLVAALTFALITRVKPVARPRRRELGLLALLGATGYAGYQLLLSAGERTVPAGTSALLFAAAPVLAAVFAGPVLGERLTGRGWGGLLVSVGGVAVVAAGQGLSGSGLGGPTLILGAVLLYAVWLVVQKLLLGSLSSWDVTVWATWFGALFALPFGHGLPHMAATADTAAVLGVVALGAFWTTVPFVLWSWVMARIPANIASPLLLVTAPAAVLVAWGALGEAPALSSLVGGALTIAGVAAVQLAGRRPS
jgi:drug/metabolite transporter (DMT)-like permease